MKKIFTLFTILVLSIRGYAQLTGDNYPVQAHVFVQKASLKLPEYFSNSQVLSLDLILKDLTKSTVDVYLGWQITGVGLGIEAGSVPGYVAPDYITLTKGSRRSLRGTDLRDYFRPGILATSGVSENTLFNGKLPEGFYTFKVTAYEAGTGRQVSNTAETFFSVAYALPPVINLPLIGSEQPATRPQSVLLQWMPRHTATGSNLISYRGKVCEVAEDENPSAAITSSQTCFEIPPQRGTSYPLKASDLPLKVGKRYAFQVQVEDLSANLEFQNQGFSEVTWFRFGEACKPPTGLQVNAVAPGRLNVSWNAYAQATGYKLLYRSENQTGWTEQTTLGTSVSLVSLNPELDYEFKVITVCEIGNESPESETVTWQAEGPADPELEQLRERVLNPLSQPVASSGNPGAQTMSTVPLPQTFEDLIPSDPARIPCHSQLHSYEECSDQHPEGHVIQGGLDLLALKAGDLVTIYDYLVVLTQVSGGNNIFSGKGLIKMPFLDDHKMPVEFSNVEIRRQSPDQNGGCVTHVNGYFRVRNGLTSGQIRQEETDLIHTVRTRTDSASIYVSRDQVITQLSEELSTTGKDLCEGKAVTDEARQSLLQKHLLARQGLQEWAQEVADLYDELDMEGDEVLSRTQPLIHVLEANIATLESGPGCPESREWKMEIKAITEKIKADIEKRKEPTDDLPKIMDVVVKNITDSEATITWKGDKRFTKYLVSYQTEGQGIVVKEVTKPTLLLGELAQNSTYNFTIKGIAEKSEDNFGPKEFTTLKSAFPPIENLMVMENDSLSYKIIWDKNKEHKSYKIEYTKNDGFTVVIYTEKNYLIINEPTNSIIKVTAFDKGKKLFSLANTAIFALVSASSSGISQILTSNELAVQDCYYKGSCVFNVGCTSWPTLWDPKGLTVITLLESGVHPLDGNCLRPTYDKYLYQNCSIDDARLISVTRVLDCKEKDENTSNGNNSGSGVGTGSPLKDIEKDICIQNNETEPTINSAVPGEMYYKMNVPSPFPLCNFDYNTCLVWAQNNCNQYEVSYSLRRLLHCKKVRLHKWMFCGNVREKKIKPATKEGIYNDSTYHFLPDTTFEELSPPEVVMIMVIPRLTPGDENCFATHEEIPKCYLETLKNNSANYESLDMLMYQIDKSYKNIMVQMAPNGDMYYEDSGTEYWKIGFKYTIARTTGNQWYSYDFQSGKWCRFEPFEPKLEVESTKRCSEVDVIRLKASGIAPFTYYLTGANGTTSEYTSDEASLELSDLVTGTYTISVSDANGCKSSPKMVEVRRTTSLDFNISKFYDCENTVYITPICGKEPYTYNYQDDSWQTHNKITGLQNYLIDKKIKSHSFTIKVKDSMGAVREKVLFVQGHEYLVKIKNKGTPVRIETVTSEEWNKEYSRGLFPSYTAIKYFEKNSIVNVRVKKHICKPASLELEFPYAKLPLTLNIESDNGYRYSKTIEKRNITIDGLSSGRYKISGIDANECKLETSKYENNEVEITTNTLALTVSPPRIICGSSNSIIHINVENQLIMKNGDDGIYNPKYFNYTFYLNDKQVAKKSGSGGVNMDINAGPGTHFIKVEVENEGCSVSQQITLPDIPVLTLTGQVYTDSGENAACTDNPATRVNVSLSPQGGQLPYTYIVSTRKDTYTGNLNVFNNLENTDMTVSVRDKNGCTASFTYHPFDPPIVIPAVQNAACGANGKITVTVTGGNPPYRYSINGLDFQDSPVFENLDAGNYTVTVKDAFNCTASAVAVVEDSKTLDFDTSIAYANCIPGQKTNIITVIPLDGEEPYTYKLNNQQSQTSPYFENVSPGTYTITVSDASGCVGVKEVTLENDHPLEISTSLTYENCVSGTTNSITVYAGCGTPPYQYSIDGGSTFHENNVFNNLPDGTYSVIVKDGRNNTATTQAKVSKELSGLVEVESVGEVAVVAIAGARVGGEQPFTVRKYPHTRAYTFTPKDGVTITVLSPTKIKVKTTNQADKWWEGEYSVYFEKDNHNAFAGFYREGITPCTPSGYAEQRQGSTACTSLCKEGFLPQEIYDKSFTPYLIARSFHKKGMNHDNTGPHHDMMSCDMEDEEIIQLNYKTREELGLSERELIGAWKIMIAPMSINLFENNFAMVDKFISGVGGEYSNPDLTEAGKTHQNTRLFINRIKQNLEFKLKNDEEFIKNKGVITYEVGNPRPIGDPLRREDIPSPTWDDKFTGLGIAVNDTWGYGINLTKFILNKDNRSYTASFDIEIFDHFGLDSLDIDPKEKLLFSQMSGFRSWFILQHSKKHCKMPFITVIKFNETINGNY